MLKKQLLMLGIFFQHVLLPASSDGYHELLDQPVAEPQQDSGAYFPDDWLPILATDPTTLIDQGLFENRPMQKYIPPTIFELEGRYVSRRPRMAHAVTSAVFDDKNTQSNMQNVTGSLIRLFVHMRYAADHCPLPLSGIYPGGCALFYTLPCLPDQSPIVQSRLCSRACLVDSAQASDVSGCSQSSSSSETIPLLASEIRDRVFQVMLIPETSPMFNYNQSIRQISTRLDKTGSYVVTYSDGQKRFIQFLHGCWKMIGAIT